MLEFLIGAVILVLDIIAIISVIQSGLEPLKKVIWILLIIFLPVLGMILWFLLGRK